MAMGVPPPGGGSGGHGRYGGGPEEWLCAWGRAREARISGGAVAMLRVNESESDSDESDSDPEASGSCKDAGRFKRDALATMAEVGARGGAEARREGGS